jgi:hypothetical protein
MRYYLNKDFFMKSLGYCWFEVYFGGWGYYYNFLRIDFLNKKVFFLVKPKKFYQRLANLILKQTFFFHKNDFLFSNDEFTLEKNLRCKRFYQFVREFKRLSRPKRIRLRKRL